MSSNPSVRYKSGATRVRGIDKAREQESRLVREIELALREEMQSAQAESPSHRRSTIRVWRREGDHK